MLTKTGSKLLDFGLAKLRRPRGPISMSGMTRLATRAPETAHGTILGTVQYMAPEQVEGKEADARSDIWALGAVIYEMVTGAAPVHGRYARERHRRDSERRAAADLRAAAAGAAGARSHGVGVSRQRP